MSQEFQEFRSRFNFKKDFRGYIGVERERFLTTPDGKVAPRAKEFLEKMDNSLWTYELSACQVEDRTRPRFRTVSVWYELFRNDMKGKCAARELGLGLASFEVGPKDMPLQVYPDSRYLEISKWISEEQLRAACRVAGVHIHVGTENLDEAVKVYNALRKYLNLLCRIGDHSGGERLRLYKTMATIWEPPIIENVEHFFAIAREQGFHKKPRSCYWLIRISIHGTVELRMFGSTKSRARILNYITVVRRILFDAGVVYTTLGEAFAQQSISIWR